MEIKRDWIVVNIWLNHKKYIETVLKCFNMQDCTPTKLSILVGDKLMVE
jgi:hypothetical protein